MTKLKIGTVKPKEEEKNDDYFNELSDEELQSIQDEVNEITDETVEEVAPITEDITEEVSDEEEIEEAINGVNMLDKVGIHINYINKFIKKHPNRKTVYRNLITKTFLTWYIKNANASLLNDLDIIDSEYVNQNHTPYLMQLIQTRLHEEIEEEDKTGVEHETGINLKTEQEIEMYELLLNEKWDKNRAKGILELDSLIMEQIRIHGKECNVQHALEFLIKTFKLVKKLKTIAKTEKKLIETIKPKDKRMTSAEEKANIKHSILYFTYLKFLYNLMSEKMDFNQLTSKEEEDMIAKITNLIENRTELTPTEKKKEKKEAHQTVADTMLDKFLEGGE